METALSRKQFDILTFLERLPQEIVSQREIAEATGMSVGSVNRILVQLRELGYLDRNLLTPEGRTALEPYRVKRGLCLKQRLNHLKHRDTT